MGRVAFVGGRGFRSDYGGVENAIRHLSQELAALTEDEVWVTGQGQGRWFERSMERGVWVLSAPGWISRWGHSATTLALSLYLICWLRPHTVMLFASGPSLFSPLYRLAGIRAIGCLRALDSQRDGWKGLNKWILQAGEFAATRLASASTVNSLAMQRHFAARNVSTHYIPNGISPAAEPMADYLAQLGLEPERYLLFAARLDPVKRLDVLLRAHGQLSGDARLPLVVAGGNCKSAAYQARIKALAGDDVIFLGHVGQRELSTLMAHCCLFISPSILEGMSNSLLSAIGAHRCVLCADVPENADVVKGDARVLFEPDNVGALRALIEAYVLNPDRRKRVASDLVETTEELNWHRSAQSFYRLIRPRAFDPKGDCVSP